MSSARRYAMGLVLLIVAAAGVYLCGIGRVSLFDRDEPWYAQASRQMLQTGDWTMIYFLDQPRYAKPVLFYWCQAASMRLFGDNALGARMPSVIAMTGVLVVLAWTIGRSIGIRRAFFTVLVFCTSALVIATAKLAITDAVQLLFITGAQLCLFVIYSAKSLNDTTRLKHTPILLLWLCVGLAILTKGPFVLAVLLATMLALALMDVGRPVLSAAAWRRAIAWWPATRPLWGLLIITLIVLPWGLMLLLSGPESRQFLLNMLKEPLAHAGGSPMGHAGPPGYHLAGVWLFHFPWSLLLPAALITGIRHRRLAPVRFALATILGTWIFVELMVNKLPHYLLPAYSAMAFLTADALVRCLRMRASMLTHPAFLAGAAAWGVATILLALLPWLARGPFPGLFCTSAVGAITTVGILYALVVFAAWTWRRQLVATLAMASGMMLIVVLLYGWFLPTAQFLRLPQRIADTLHAHRPHDAAHAPLSGDVVMIGYTEPSLAFHQGGTIRPMSLNELQARPIDAWPRWLVICDRMLRQLPADQRAHYVELARHRGLNYNDGGSIVEVVVMKRREP